MHKVWIGVGVVALGAGIGLYALLAKDSDSAAKTEAPRVDNAPRVPDPGSAGGTKGDRPELPATPTTDSATGTGYTEYMTDAGVRIRDKRGRVVATDFEAPVRRPFKALDIDAKVLDGMGRELRNLARKCKTAHAGDLGEDARIQPRVNFEIKDGQLNVTEADLSLTNIKEGGEFERCFYSGAIGLAVTATGHRTVDSHKMLVPIDLDKI